ncbi:hypothetical protein ASE12_16780 [Aeromicrobium sp. Root236]|nr:hypothetical protein ASE12_16780 [Aeromicrobium sp. Root236]
MVALMGTMLLAATGLGVDTAHVVYDNGRVQHGADAGALAIALDCARHKTTCSKAGGDAIADTMVDENAGSGSGSIVGGALAPSDGQVTTHVSKSVNTNFFGAFGINNKTVDANATAKWSKHATAGDVIPFAVSLCEYNKNSLNTPTTIATDTNDVIASQIVTSNGTTLTAAHNAMTSKGLLTSCSVPSGVDLSGSGGTVKMLPGGLWMSTNGSSTNNGQLIPTAVLDTLASVDGWNVNQQDKFSQFLHPGTTILIAVYAPSTEYAWGGLRKDGTKAAWKGTVDLKILGYAPFQVSGWCFGTKCYGASSGASKIAGKFTSSAEPFDHFTYGEGGAEFGALKVELTN